jgi:2,3-bisphosphoglycerate-independent phosphoglycerate mutase
MANRKICYVILDGLGDEPHPRLGDRTPLEAAKTPNLDSVARKGRSGIVTTVGEGIAPESDIAVFAILGYDPHTQHAGRGPVEALGAGIDMRTGDLAWRANFATADENLYILDRRAGRDLSTDEAKALADAVNAAVELPGGAQCTLLATSEHRAVLHIRDDRPLSAEVSNSDPAYARQGSLGVALETFDPRPQPVTPLEETDAATTAASLTNEWLDKAHDVLGRHQVNAARIRRGRPAGNIVLVRDAGNHIPEVESLRSRFGMSFACFAEMPVEIGISKVTGMDPILVSASGTDPSAYALLAEKTVEALDGYDALYVHIKGPDVPAHDGRAEDKRDVVSAIDEGYFGTLLPELRRSVILAVTADHSTSCVRKAHTADPVPLVVAGGLVSPDGSRAYSESEAPSGALGHMQGVDVLPMLVTLARE